MRATLALNVLNIFSLPNCFGCFALLASLVFIITVFEFSHFPTPEWQYPSVENVQGRKTFQGLHHLLKTPQLNDSSLHSFVWGRFPSNIYLIKVNTRNTRKMCKICSKLTIKTPLKWCSSGVFIANFKHILHLFVKC